MVVRSPASALSLLAGLVLAALAALAALLAALLAGILLLLAGLAFATLVLAALVLAALVLAALLAALIWVLVSHWELLLFAGQSRTASTSRQWFWFPPRGLRQIAAN
jgi:hypothetical protein